jgi:uncharacterized phage-associated protein
MTGPHDPCHVANYFIDRGIKREDPFTPMQIQKLVYFSHGWMLGIYNRPLLEKEFEAWRYGPVMPVVYYNLSYYGGDPVDDQILAHVKDFDEDERDILDQVFDVYGEFGGVRLSRMTHVRGGPWDQIWRKHKRQARIPNELIEKYFADIVDQESSPNDE